MKKLRIGILSTADIGKKNWKAIYHAGNCAVTAVASREPAKSQAFIEQCQQQFAFDPTPDALGSYDALISAANVDAIYFPLPTGLRKEWVIQAARAGKHILCEKPAAASRADLEEMLAACRQHQVQFMDGVMFMHSPRMASVREVLDNGQSVGGVRRMSSGFSFNPGEAFFQENIRANGALEPAGSLGDLGWYSIRFILWTMNWQLPQSVTGRILTASENRADRPSAPVEFSGELLFAGGVSAEFYASFLAAKQQWVHVSGEKGWLRVPDFVHPFNGYEPAFEVNEKFISVPGEVPCPPDADPMAQGHATAQDTRMWRNFADQIFSGNLNADWPLWTLKTQAVLDACLAAARQGSPVKL